MTDAEMRKKARRAKRLETKAAELQSEADDLKAELVAELKERGNHIIEGGGVRVTLVAPEQVVYNEARLRKLLARRPEAWEACLDAPRFSKDRLAAAVQEGLIDMTLVDRITEVVPTKAYVRITTAPGR